MRLRFGGRMARGPGMCRLRMCRGGSHRGFGGMVDFEALFAALGADGYDGFISAEYHPGEAGTNAGLGWMKAL